jgi:hypothetical protein
MSMPRRASMFGRALVGMLWLPMACFVGEADAQSQRVFRCVIDGKVTFQQAACQSAEEAKSLEVKPGNTIAATPRPPVSAASTPAVTPPPQPPQRSALDAETEACLAHLRPFLRDPRSAYASAPAREGRVLSLTVHAVNSRGGIGSRKAACEFFNGSVDASWTKIHLQRLGWFQPKTVIVDKRQRRDHHGHDADDIEAPPSS